MASLVNFPVDRRLTRSEAHDLVDLAEIEDLMRAAAERRDAAHGDAITFSPKVFIPLTQLCRDVCHYCTFAHAPRIGAKAYLTVAEAVAIAKAGRTRAATRRCLHWVTSPSYAIAPRKRS